MASSSTLRQRMLWLMGGFFFFFTRAIAFQNPMLHPVAGDLIPLGQPYTIRWIPGTPGSVDITLFKQISADEDGIANTITGEISPEFYSKLTNGYQIRSTDTVFPGQTPNNGSFIWIPGPDDVEDYGYTDYSLQICQLVENDSPYDCTVTSGGYFSFTNGTTNASDTSSSATTFTLASSTSESALTSTPSSSSTADTSTLDTLPTTSATSAPASSAMQTSSATSLANPTPTNAAMHLRNCRSWSIAAMGSMIAILVGMNGI